MFIRTGHRSNKLYMIYNTCKAYTCTVFDMQIRVNTFNQLIQGAILCLNFQIMKDHFEFVRQTTIIIAQLQTHAIKLEVMLVAK